MDRKRTWRAVEYGFGHGMGRVLLVGKVVEDGAHHGREVFVEMTAERARVVAAGLIELAGKVEEQERRYAGSSN